MRRLPRPAFDAWVSTSHAASSFAGQDLQKKVNEARLDLLAEYKKYEDASEKSEWFNLEHCDYGKGNQIIIAELTKSDLKKLYSEGFVGGCAEARDIYDKLKVAAAGKCPYCAGIGDVDPLDHFLPKSRYPQFAVLPINLVPTCDRCNKLSGGAPIVSVFNQTINPYFDDERFFSDSWISLEFLDESLSSYRYVFNPPEAWPETYRRRAQKHFNDFRLAERYAATASQEVGYIQFEFIPLMMRIGNREAISQQIEGRALSASYAVNGWIRPLYRALGQADWFLSMFDA